MRLLIPGRPHLTYCTNVHPAEGSDELLAVLEGPVTAVARDVANGAPFGIGLRVGARAAHELRAASAREELTDVLRRMNAYVFTLNGFPYGPFHGHPVKERVYRPDWREHARLEYTRDLADLLAAVLPEDVAGSISTVPGGFGGRATTDADRSAIAARLLAAAADLVDVERCTGRAITLALEPEPGCVLETAFDAAAFFREHLFAERARARFASMVRTDARTAEALLRRHLGVCLDACHLAVAFEEPGDALAALAGDGVRLAKLQVSAAIQVEGADAARAALPPLDDGVYLHQTNVAQPNGTVRRFLDLPEALGEAPEGLWRVHAHVPVDRDPPAPLATTKPSLTRLLRQVTACEATSHIEVETYTWSVLPRSLRGDGLVEDVARELRWTRAVLTEGR